mmetsp:Transcript_51884/g.93096  ORF Transcript_51884/g.93096 Transcript_51884/m.93096 type:complete len:122 (-) Transcript_51884:68-433(-)
MRSSSGLLVLAVLACIGFSGMSFVGPAKEAVPRAGLVSQNFFGEKPPPPKPKKMEKFEGGFWGIIEGVDAYTKKGSASLNGPLAGVPWMTIIYLIFFFWITNFFIVEGAKDFGAPPSAAKG